MASSMLYVGLERQQEAIISGTTTYSADLWDGWSLSYEGLAIATAKNEAEAIQEAKDWAKTLRSSVPEDAWLRIIVNGVMRTYRVGEL
jgi:hypothetical protein